MLIKKITLTHIIYSIILFIVTFIILKEYNQLFLLSDSSESNSLSIYKSMIANDSRRYYQMYLELGDDIKNIFALVFINKNLIPPIFSLYIFNGNLDLLYIFFFISFSISISILIHNIKYNKNIILFFLIFYPVVFSNLYSPNKEISSLISILFLLSYILFNKKKYLYLSISFALLTRFELVIVIIIYIFFKRIKNIKRSYILLIFLMLVSFVITKIDNRGLYFLSNTGVMAFIAKLDQLGFHFLTVFLKFFMNVYSVALIPNTSRLGAIVITLSGWYFILLTIQIIRKKVFNLNNDIVFFILIYIIVFTSTAFVQHRYFIALYPLFVYLAFSKKYKKVIK